MSKYVNISVSTKVSTDFFIEVPDNLSDDDIKERAKKEVVLPHQYPSYINKFLITNYRLNLRGIDSMLHSWNSDELEIIIK